MNTVYNFGHIFDGIRDTYLFFVEDPRGNPKAVYQMGYNLGQALYYFITPNIADYYSDSKPYRVKSLDLDPNTYMEIDPADMTPEERDAAAARAKLLEKRLREADEAARQGLTVDGVEDLIPIAAEKEKS